MSENTDTSGIEWLVIIVLLLVGVVFLAKPATATVGAFADFVDAFPSPNTLGPYGSFVAALSLLLGSGGVVRNKLGGE